MKQKAVVREFHPVVEKMGNLMVSEEVSVVSPAKRTSQKCVSRLYFHTELGSLFYLFKMTNTFSSNAQHLMDTDSVEHIPKLSLLSRIPRESGTSSAGSVLSAAPVLY